MRTLLIVLASVFPLAAIAQEIKRFARPAARRRRLAEKQGYHYNRNAETHMEVGLRLGEAVKALLTAKP